MKARRRLLAPALALALAAALAPARPAQGQETYRFVYLMSMGGIEVGTVTDDVTFAESGYRIESRAVAQGLAAVFFGGEFTRISEGAFDPDNGLRPLRYVQTYGGEERSASFDWEGGSLELSWGKGAKQVKLQQGEDGYHDRLSFLYQPFAVCAAHAGLYRVTDGRRLSEYQYEKASEAAADGPLGKVEAVRLERIKSDKRSVLRLASSRGMAPLSFHTANGSSYRFVLLEAQGVPESGCAPGRKAPEESQ